jgi:hypothetical protein
MEDCCQDQTGITFFTNILVTLLYCQIVHERNWTKSTDVSAYPLARRVVLAVSIKAVQECARDLGDFC